MERSSDWTAFQADRPAAGQRPRDPTRQVFAPWMTSFVVHLSAFLLLTSFTQPTTIQRRGQSGGQLTLTVSLGGMRQGEQPIVRLTTPRIPAQAGEMRSPPRADEPTKAAKLLGPHEPSDRVPPSGQVVDRQPEQAPNLSRTGTPPSASASTSMYARFVEQYERMHEVGSPDRAEAETLRQRQYAAIRARHRDSPHNELPMANVRAVAQPLTVESRALAQQYDRVIEDFIDYDLGQLRGRAGWAARDRLMALGPDAVPALVRGLNRSAAIHASCPVGVLAGKLMQVLRESGDPTWKQFAVDHLGEGVPHNAPHFRRIIALRDRWLGGSASSMAAASRLVDSAGVAESGQVMELALALGDAPAETLLVYLEGDDSILQSAAMVALVQNPTAYPPRVRGRLLLVLNRLANTAADKSTRVLARRAVKSLPAAS